MKKKYRLLKNDDFRKVIGKQRFFSNQAFSLYYFKNDLQHLRLGISVGHKFGNAVERNKVKRQVRMMVSQNVNLNMSIDIVLMIRKGYQKDDYDSNCQKLLQLYEKVKGKVE